MGVFDTPVLDRGQIVASFDLADHAVPTGREEAWRFTPLRRLRGLHDGSATNSPMAPEVVVTAPPGVTVETVEADDPRLGATGAPDDRVEAQTVTSAASATVVTVPREWAGADPVRIVVRGTSPVGASWSRLLVDVGPFAEAVVIVDHVGTGDHGTVTEVVTADNARVTYVSVQGWDGDTVHVGRQRFRVGRDASVKALNATVGGDLVRVYTTVDYAGTGGDADLLGVFFADAGQHLEHRLFIDHAVPSCRSRVTYKGALQGEHARTVWIGDVLIRAQAHATDTYELNRNLVLTNGARADSVPNLEIETGEIVGAGHASATGRFDDEQLFYLQARGIPAADARRLVVRGFFADVINKIEIPEVQDRLIGDIESELQRSETGAA